MQQTVESLLKFRNVALSSAEAALDSAVEERRKATYDAIMKCKHEHVGRVEAGGGRWYSAGRICLQCGLFEEDYCGGFMLKHVELPYHITADVSRVITVTLPREEIAVLLQNPQSFGDTLERLVKTYR